MTAHHCYYGMEYTEDRRKIAEWVPLVMEGRTADEPVAATRIVTGTDVDYGSVTNHLVDHLVGLSGFARSLSESRHDISAARRTDDGGLRSWMSTSGEQRSVTTKFVFIGAGGGALPLLQKSGIPEGQGIWRLSGQRHLAALRRP